MSRIPKKLYDRKTKQYWFYYFLTIKAMFGQSPKINSYKKWVLDRFLSDSDQIHSDVFELGKQKRLHYHLIFRSKRKYDETDFSDLGMNSKFKIVDTYKYLVQLSYMYFDKELAPDECSEEEMEVKQDYHKEPMFVDDDMQPDELIYTSSPEKDYRKMFDPPAPTSDYGGSGDGEPNVYHPTDDDLYQMVDHWLDRA